MSKPPFHSFAFTLIENRRPRTSLRIRVSDNDLYELKVQKGSASNPSSQFTREIPREVVERFRDSLQSIGVFGWDESYGDNTAPGSRRWTVHTVFEEGVFSVESKGGSDVPAGFDQLLEQLYRLDFPRPAKEKRSTGPRLGGGMSIGDFGAYAASGFDGADFSQLADALKDSGLSGIDAANGDPRLLEQRLKDEFRHLPAEQQQQLLDALASTGLASREWWKRFFGM